MVLLTSMFVISFGLSGWAVLAAGALVASLLAVGASPTGAATDTADNTTRLSACVGDALGDQMFTDVSDGHAFKDAINCIAYYEITNGTGDGSTYSPNQDVTRAEMAVFIARAAEAAGVDLGDAMSAGFSDIGDAWSEAQDAINRLASKGMISSGGAFRPGDAITRGEMASFLIGLLNKAAPNVTIDSNGAIQLGSTGSTMVADDHFADARASVPAANDAEISAIYELGITKGASAAAVQNELRPPLDYNYEPFGTVNRGEMAAFITRALAHTSVRPAGISAQFDGTNVVVSARDENFAPMANVTVDVFRTDTAGVDLAFRANGSCGEVGKVSATGMHSCEIDGSDLFTGGGGDASVALGDVNAGGTTVWAWTGDNMDTVGSDTELYQLDVPESAATRVATRVRVSTGFAGAKAHLGSSVLYTVQLEDAMGAVTIGTDNVRPRPAQFLVTLSTYAIIDTDPATDGLQPGRNPQGASVVTTLPLTTDADGKATFSVSGLPDPAPSAKVDKYTVDIQIQPAPNGNAPAAATDAAGNTSANNYFIGATATTAAGDDAVNNGLVDVKVDDTTSATTFEGLVFSTEARDLTAATVSVSPPTAHVAAAARGASNRATATVADQYGDPIAGAKVTLTSSLNTGAAPATDVVIAGGRAVAVGGDGSYTFGYTRVPPTGTLAAAETLTATWVYTQDANNDGTADDPASHTGTATVEWAGAPAATETSGQDIVSFDTDTNTIFTGGTGAVVVLNYDSNDRFNIDLPDPDGAGLGADPPQRTSTYAEFERNLGTGTNYDLLWTIAGTGSRAVNTFTLVIT